MHISEGVLGAPLIAGGWAAAAAGTAIGLSKMDSRLVPRTGLMAAVFFVASLVHLPLGPASVHLLLGGITGIVLGWAAFPAMLAALLMQALLFQFGGFTALGLNTAVMAFPAVLCGSLWAVAGRSRRPWMSSATAFLCGAGAVMLSACLNALCLAATEKDFMAAALAVIAAHLPVAAVEGVVTASAVSFLRTVKPEILSIEANPV